MGISMTNNLLTINQITAEALSVLESELTGHKEYRVEGCGSNWAIVERLWGKSTKAVATYKTKADAEAVLKIINFTERNYRE